MEKVRGYFITVRSGKKKDMFWLVPTSGFVLTREVILSSINEAVERAKDKFGTLFSNISVDFSSVDRNVSVYPFIRMYATSKDIIFDVYWVGSREDVVKEILAGIDAVVGGGTVVSISVDGYSELEKRLCDILTEALVRGTEVRSIYLDVDSAIHLFNKLEKVSRVISVSGNSTLREYAIGTKVLYVFRSVSDVTSCKIYVVSDGCVFLEITVCGSVRSAEVAVRTPLRSVS